MTRFLAPMLLTLTLGACHSARDTGALMDQARQYRGKGETKGMYFQLENIGLVYRRW